MPILTTSTSTTKYQNKMKKHKLFVLGFFTAMLSSAFVINAQPVKDGKKISPDLFGLFFEDINYAADGGLYAEMVQNRSFEYSPRDQGGWNSYSYWDYISPGYSIGNISIKTNEPIHPNNPHYMILTINFVGNYEQFKGEAGVGLLNYGFDGMIIRQGDNYNFSMFAKLFSQSPIEFLISLQNKKGEVLAQNRVKASSTNWQKYSATLTATTSCDTAQLVVLAKNKGEIALDMISLFPEKTFKNRTNGLRNDLAQTLADLQPRFVRFPGGCLVHGDGLGNMYRWKNTIGPVEQRKGQRNIWNYHQTGGLGYFEYFQFCEDIGAKPVPVLPAAVSCQNTGGTHVIGGAGQKALPVDEMKDYIQEVLDLIEWANGPATSEWGKKRAESGHPEPFNLEYLGIGNEDKMTPEFEERFKMIYKAVAEKHPEITLIGTVGPFHQGKDFDKGWEIANELQIPIVDEHYYVGPEWFLNNQQRYDSYNRKASEVYLGEYASWGNKLRNAIAEAAYMTGLESNGDIVRMASYAPLTAKIGFTQWTTDLIFFDNANIYPTPNYYVQKMFMTNQGDYYYDNVTNILKTNTTMGASCIVDSKSGDIILKLVNANVVNKNVSIDLTRFGKIIAMADKTLLNGDPEAKNTPHNPNTIIPKKSTIKVNKKFDSELPAMSLTVIRIKTKK